MNAPAAMPAPVLEGLRRYGRQHSIEGEAFEAFMASVRWGLDHYYFWRAGTYHGVELNGYVHT